eukprot:IDg18299t1
MFASTGTSSLRITLNVSRSRRPRISDFLALVIAIEEARGSAEVDYFGKAYVGFLVVRGAEP